MKNNKSKVMNWVIGLSSFTFVCIIAGGLIGQSNNTKALVYASTSTPAVVTAQQKADKIETLKKDIVYQIKACETQAKTESDAVIILDSNNQMSIGLWQFQIKTVQQYYKQLYGKDITRLDAVQIALDEDKAAKLATDIMFKVPDGWKNWRNCGTQKEVAVQINLLNSLEN